MNSDIAATAAANESILIWNAKVASPPALVSEPKTPEQDDGSESHPQGASFLEER